MNSKPNVLFDYRSNCYQFSSSSRSPDYTLVPSVQEATSETRVSHPLSFPYGSVYISVEVSQRQKGGKVKLY